jgi:hypothetical protein
MPVPYRKTPKTIATGLAAFIDVAWIEPDRTLYGGLLVIDAIGQPVEFVHNYALAPTGLAWDPHTSVRLGTPQLVHTLFDACRREPDLLVVMASSGSPEFVNAEIAPAVPCAMVTPAQGALPAEWSWINTPPTTGMRASFVSSELERRGLFIEPFARLRQALQVVYPQAAWHYPEDDDGV